MVSRSLPLRTLLAASLALFSCGGVKVDSTRSTGGGGAGGTSPSEQAGGAGLGTSDAGTPDATPPDATSPGATPEGPRSGSRLRVRGWAIDDVATANGEIWDTERGVACAPRGNAEGGQRCLPVGNEARVYFTDPGCTQPIAGWSVDVEPCGDPEIPRYALAWGQPHCLDTDIAVFEVGEPLPPPASVYLRSDSGCGPSGSEEHYFRAVPSPAADWVRLELEVTPVTPRLGVAYFRGDDGSRILEGLRLWPEDVPCTEQDVGSGMVRCIPAAGGMSDGYFAGESCERPVNSTPPCAAPPQLVSVSRAQPGPPTPVDPCEAAIHLPPLYRAEAVDRSRVYSSVVEGSCVPAGPTVVDYDYYAAGPLVPYDEFPVVDSVRDGTGRFQQVYAVGDGRKLFAREGQLFDAEQGAACDVYRTDTRAFCIPSGALLPVSNIVFEDARCQSPLVATSVCNPVAPRAVFDSVLDACTNAPVVRVGARRADAPAALHVADPVNGLCGPSQQADQAFYDLGAPIDLAEVFPQVTAMDL